MSCRLGNDGLDYLLQINDDALNKAEKQALETCKKYVNMHGEYSLHRYILSGSVNTLVLRFFYESGFGFNAPFGYDTPLNLACSSSVTPSILEFIVKKVGDINASHEANRNPLYILCDSQYVVEQNLEVLIKHGAIINPKKEKISEIPLHAAVQNVWASIRITEFLLKKGANVNLKDSEGNTALHLVFKNKPVEVQKEYINLLLSNGAEINSRNNSGMTPIFTYIEWTNGIQDTILELLISNGASLDVQDVEGETPLHTYLGRLVVSIKTLQILMTETNILLEDNYGRLPLHLVCGNLGSTKEMIKLFLDKGGNINSADDGGYTPLHMICLSHADVDLIDFFLQNNADFDKTTDKRDTILHTACRFGRPIEFIKLIAVYVGNAFVENEEKKTPLDYLKEIKREIKRKRYKELIDFFQKIKLN